AFLAGEDLGRIRHVLMVRTFRTAVERDDNDVSFFLRGTNKTFGLVEVVHVRRDRIVCKADEGDLLALYGQVRGRVSVPVASGVFDVEGIERFACALAAAVAEIARVIVGKAEYVKAGVF